MNAPPGRYKQNRLQQLRGFYHAARTRSISKAAEKMLLTQPSVSLQIKALEKELGTELFERRGPRIRLTEDGQTLLELARPLVEGIDQLEQDFAARRDSAEYGTVTIAAGGSTIQYILPRFVDQFVNKYPHVDVRLRNVTGKSGLKLLREGEVDFAVGPMLDAPPDIQFLPLFTFEPVLIISPEHPLAKRKRVTLQEISQYPLVMPPKEQSTYRAVEAVFNDHALNFDVKLEVGGYEVIKQYVRLNFGVSIVMSHCLSNRDELLELPVKRYFPKRTYGVVTRRGRKLQPAARRFVETLEAGQPTKVAEPDAAVAEVAEGNGKKQREAV